MDQKILNNIKRIKEIIVEGGNLDMVQLKQTNYSNLKYDTDQTQYDYVNKSLLDDLNEAGKATNIVLTITTAKSGHNSYVKGKKVKSRHMFGTGVDIALLDGIGDKYANHLDYKKDFREKGDKIKNYLVNNLGYTWNVESGNPKAVLWLTYAGGNHYNHLHVSNQNVESSEFESEESSTKDGQDIEMKTDENLPEDVKLFQKIMGSEYLGMKVSDWVEVKKDPMKMLQFVFKLLDF
jgi:hypothetical protein